MNKPPFPGILALVCLPILAVLGSATAAVAQDLDPEVKEAYFRAVAQYFEVPSDEVAIVGDWDLAADEVPVVLFIAGRAGVSPDALIGLRHRGTSWHDVARQLGLGSRNFHVPLPEGEPLGPLAQVYGRFREEHPRNWNQIELQDPDIVFMVNIRVLSEQVGVPPIRVLQARIESGSFAAGYVKLIGPPGIV